LENTIYRSYRWQFVRRDLDATIIDIKETKFTKVQNIGYIAKLNKEKNEIINVYLDKKVAAKNHGYGHSALDLPVKNFTLSNGHYYILYENCEDILKLKFIKKNNGEPILYKDGIGQYDYNNILIKEFVCKSYCCKSLSISDRTLNKALENCVLYNNNYFKYMDAKLMCFLQNTIN
jgi:hypothetical protein